MRINVANVLNGKIGVGSYAKLFRGVAKKRCEICFCRI